MDSKVSSPAHAQPNEKRAYSPPGLVELGSIEEFALGGVGSVAEMMQMLNVMKHP